MNQNEINRLNELSQEIGKWSEENFGDNGMGEFKHCRPLMGITEEYGEYIDATRMDDIRDALADMGIYCLDFCYQTGCVIQEVDWEGLELESCLGKMNRIVLKRIQKIRGYDDDNKFESELTFYCSCFFHVLDDNLYAGTIGKTYPSIVQLIDDVWEKTVSKRNWKANKENGAANV
jgi:NTP pyrophosphatase (non-canonical NTP hydrolase)